MGNISWRSPLTPGGRLASWAFLSLGTSLSESICIKCFANGFSAGVATCAHDSRWFLVSALPSSVLQEWERWSEGRGCFWFLFRPCHVCEMQSGTWAVVRTKITQTARVPGAPALSRICLYIYLAFLFMPVGCWSARAPRMPRPGQTWVKCSLETGQVCVSSQSCVSSYALTLTEWPVLKWPLVALSVEDLEPEAQPRPCSHLGFFCFGLFFFCFFFFFPFYWSHFEMRPWASQGALLADYRMKSGVVVFLESCQTICRLTDLL